MSEDILTPERESAIRERLGRSIAVSAGELTVTADPRYPGGFYALTTSNPDMATFLGHAEEDVDLLLREVARMQRIVSLIPTGMRTIVEGAAAPAQADTASSAVTTPIPRRGKFMPVLLKKGELMV